MNSPLRFRSRHRGVVLVITLIMLLIITLTVTTAFNLSTTNLKSVGNMQFWHEALNAGNVAVEERISSGFGGATSLVATTSSFDIDQNSSDDYNITITPTCVRTISVESGGVSSLSLGSAFTGSSDMWNVVIDVKAEVSDAAGMGTSVVVHTGVRELVDNTTKEAICP